MNAQLTDDINKHRDKIEGLLKSIEELDSAKSENQFQARRAERELREERDKVLRLEREMEGWKALRIERGTASGRLSLVGPSLNDGGSNRGSIPTSNAGQNGSRDIPQRKPSDSKGFL
jgi:myosin heavy chain 9/10/11/14